MKQIFVRQGDVGLAARPHLGGNIPDAKPVPREDGRIILAHGEVTGHAHAIVGDGVDLLETPDGRRFLQLVAPQELTHEEHGTINLPEGTYEVIRQSEYSPEAIRNVAD